MSSVGASEKRGRAYKSLRRNASGLRRSGGGELALLGRLCWFDFRRLNYQMLLLALRMEERDDSEREGMTRGTRVRGVELAGLGGRGRVLKVVAGLEVGEGWPLLGVEQLRRVVRHGEIAGVVFRGAGRRQVLVARVEIEGAIPFEGAVHERILLSGRLVVLSGVFHAQMGLTLREEQRIRIRAAREKNNKRTILRSSGCGLLGVKTLVGVKASDSFDVGGETLESDLPDSATRGENSNGDAVECARGFTGIVYSGGPSRRLDGAGGGSSELVPDCGKNSCARRGAVAVPGGGAYCPKYDKDGAIRK